MFLFITCSVCGSICSCLLPVVCEAVYVPVDYL